MEEINSLPNPPASPEMPTNLPIKSSSLNKSLLIILLVIFVIVLSSLISYFLIKSQTPSKTPVNSPALLTKATPIPNPMANWKTYTSKQMSFSVKYPLNLYTKEEISHGTPDIIFSNQPFITTQTTNNPNNSDFSKTYNAAKISTLQIIKTLSYNKTNLENDAMQRNIPPIPLKKININGMEAFATNPTVVNIPTVGESTTKSYYFRAIDGDLYIITEYVSTTDKDSGSTFDQILSTFKFAD